MSPQLYPAISLNFRGILRLRAPDPASGGPNAARKALLFSAHHAAFRAQNGQACHTPYPASLSPIASSTSISFAASYGIGL